tara:strand:+ start:4067 stop:5149 length:1083 start_codon:yes stop_codon:yes gene_type:complete
MAITNLDSLRRQQEMNNRLRASASQLNPIFGQQQQGNSYSLPMGGNNFMRANQIGGASRINVFKTPEPKLTPEQLEAQQFEDRAAQYQQDLAQFNLGQREAELESQRAGAEEIASGQFMIDGRAVTRAEMDQYQRGVKESGEKEQADFNRENPFYAAAKASMSQAPQPGQFSNDADYQSAISEYSTDANKKAREQQFNQSLNELRRNALTESINQFRDDPMSYLMGGGREGSSTYSPDALMGHLGQASQLFKATGQEGNFMDFMLGNTPVPQERVYQTGTSFASQGFTRDEALASMVTQPASAMQGFQALQSDNPPAFYSMPKRNSRQQPAPKRTGTMYDMSGGGGYSGIAATNARFLGL